MVNHGFDADSLRRDRQRYHDFRLQAEGQVATWTERIGHLQEAIDALDQLLALAARDAAPTGGDSVPGAPLPSPEPKAPSRSKPRAAAAKAKAASAGVGRPRKQHDVVPAAPKGTDALRLLLEAEPTRTWSLAELLEALGAKGWLAASRRPEEGVRISLKRLVERGGARRVDDGHWCSPAADPPDRAEGLPPAITENPASEPGRASATSAPRAASFGRPVGATVTES